MCSVHPLISYSRLLRWLYLVEGVVHQLDEGVSLCTCLHQKTVHLKLVTASGAGQLLLNFGPVHLKKKKKKEK